LRVRGVRPLAILVAGSAPERYDSALRLAAGHAALGGPVRMLLDASAVPLAARPQDALRDACFELGVAIMLCQTGMAEAGLSAAGLDPRFEAGGVISFLAALGEARLVVI
jgi:predicted peroxiredoxin